MPLTPEDVQNKTFGASGLGRKGYDETEVDDFLDEVYDEMARLTRENEELSTKLSACQRSLAAAQEQLRQQAAAPAQAAPAAEPTPVPTPAPAPPAPAAPAPAEAAAGILALAQRTADEHVAEAKKQADGIVGEARSRADQIARETEERQRRTLGALEHERSELERRVEGLRAFEREYRSRLKNYLENQLRELESTPEAAPGGSPARPGGAAPAPGQPGGAPAGDRPSPFSAAPPVQPQREQHDQNDQNEQAGPQGGYIVDSGPEGH
ncbi:MAG TPA: DivIVA domain-containing protein [Motilibacteraceae bacterium]|nr:DivIVA domain-containing protein [Motilibacteraceae bacterium]